ncbi:MAG TPA: hypothetical protein DCF49_01190 [Lachnospiraceae bacterium]|nr:hypothetical protein [Lachnospiraceae bacterium]
MIDFNKYFIVGTNSDALRDTMNGIVTGELIRCKNCKYNSNMEGNYVDCAIIPQMFGKTPDDNYCSWAEPKEDDG